MYWERLRDEARPDDPLSGRLALFLAGDDAAAGATVPDLTEDVGVAPVDTGPLRQGGRLQEPGSPIDNEAFTKPEAAQWLQERRR